MFFLAFLVITATLVGGAVVVGENLQLAKEKAILKNRKKYKPEDSAELIGLRDPYMAYDSSSLAVDKFDTTTYLDRAVVAVHNSTGSNLYCNGWSIRGKPVIQHAGNSGYLWEYSDYADIEANGESSYELSNRFITSTGQCEYIGDYLNKELKPHDMYTLSMHGMHHYYDLCDVYTVDITNKVNGASSENELIDVDAEVEAVTFRKTVGGIGETLVDCRVPSNAWNKTNSTSARRLALATAGDLNNRGNSVLIASAGWTGQADYYCTGTADNVLIQSVIDLLAARGGGEIRLTPGRILLAGPLELHGVDGIILTGDGYNTKLCYPGIQSAAQFQFIDCRDAKNVVIRDLCIDGENIEHTGSPFGIAVDATTTNNAVRIDGVWIENLYGYGAAPISATSTASYTYVSKSIVRNIESVGALGRAYGILDCDKVVGCLIDNITAAYIAYGMRGCTRCMHNTVGTVTAATAYDYYQSYASSTADATYACADTDAGGFNS